jgi:EpsI family protein
MGNAKLSQIISLRFGALLAVLLLAGVFINVWERAGEARATRRPLNEFPVQLADWRQVGPDQRFSPDVEGVLRADEYVSRNYARSDGRLVSMYVGYYSTQRNGVTYHSPLNCLPGSGWTLYDPSKVRLTQDDGSRSFEANRFIVQNGKDRQLLIYWYQGRGRAIASEYWDKFYTVMDSARRRRSDGAMVRLMTPITTSEAAALELAADLAKKMSASLPAYVPD